MDRSDKRRSQRRRRIWVSLLVAAIMIGGSLIGMTMDGHSMSVKWRYTACDDRYRCGEADCLK